MVKVLIIYITLFVISFCWCNENFTKSVRFERGLIYPGGGVIKLALGAIYPLYLPDKVHWRQVNCVYNLQSQYSLPTDANIWWKRWDGRKLKRIKRNFDFYNKYPPDESRNIVYTMLETYMKIRGKNGRECLLRSICENGSIDEPIGIFAEILHTILKPGISNTNDEYMFAYKAGQQFGVNCYELYPKCPRGDAVFDEISVTMSNWN